MVARSGNSNVDSVRSHLERMLRHLQPVKDVTYPMYGQNMKPHFAARRDIDLPQN